MGPVATVAAATGTALITVGGEGANTIVVSPGANGDDGRPGAGGAGGAGLGPADVVLGQAEIPAAAVVAALQAGRAAGATTVVNQAPFRPVGRRAVGARRRAGRERDRAGRAGRRRRVGRGLVVDEDGPAAGARSPPRARPPGACWRRGPGRAPSSSPSAATVPWSSPPTEQAPSVPGRAVTAVDTVGAGDCLTGWLAAGHGRGPARSARRWSGRSWPRRSPCNGRARPPPCPTSPRSTRAG